MRENIRLLLIAPHISREATGEGFAAYKIAEALQDRLHLTVLALQSPRHTHLAEQLPQAEVIVWPEPRMFQKVTRFRAMLKPEWLVFSSKVRGFLRQEAGRFDIAHQIKPAGLRYGTPLRGHRFPYVLGPFGGALDTPPSFATEAERAPWYTRLRNLDRLRLRYDRRLRGAIGDADLVLGVAPYIDQELHDAKLTVRRYANLVAIGVDPSLPPPRQSSIDGQLRLLHVGRAIRTKGLRDVVRAMGILADRHDITLESAGDGEDLEQCRREATELGVADRITFHGQISRAAVEKLYSQADLFVFPSFREPAGQVLYEAMRWGLPVIGAARGGPDAILDDSFAIKIAVTDPTRFSRDIASAIRSLADNKTLRDQLGDGARKKLETNGLWRHKATQLMSLYSEAMTLKQRRNDKP